MRRPRLLPANLGENPVPRRATTPASTGFAGGPAFAVTVKGSLESRLGRSKRRFEATNSRDGCALTRISAARFWAKTVFGIRLLRPRARFTAGRDEGAAKSRPEAIHPTHPEARIPAQPRPAKPTAAGRNSSWLVAFRLASFLAGCLCEFALPDPRRNHASQAADVATR